MKNRNRLPLILTFALLVVGILTGVPAKTVALTKRLAPSGPNRFQAVLLDITEYEWWMVPWGDENVVCAFYTDHEGLPDREDIKIGCGKEIKNQFKEKNELCTANDPLDCNSFYFINTSQRPAKKQITVKLAPPTVMVRLENCEVDDEGWCTSQPTLVLKGIEPITTEKITSVHGFAGEDRFDCDGEVCIFKLSQTNPKGVQLSFWADSSYGDSTAVYDAIVKVTKDPDQRRLIDRWKVDVLSTQWDGPEIASCAAVWKTFRPTESSPHWLRTPNKAKDLASNIPFDYLAGNLIRQGVVDASQCDNQGFNSDGSINGCGMEIARPEVTKWQNQFDELILAVAKEKEVPAQLLKNLFSRESQFWPGMITKGKDAGLGQLTEGGADTALLWNPAFYQSFCPMVLDQDTCSNTGYANLSQYEQGLLQGAMVASVNARCDDCPLGLDLPRAEQSIGIFAHTLLANCEQAGKIVENITEDSPAATLDYESMWKLTLVNYNAGSGCLGDAVTNAYDPSIDPALSWDRIRENLDIFCPGATDYVNDVAKDGQASTTPE